MAGTHEAYLSFRSNPGLNSKLDAEVKRLRDQGLPPRIANRSAVARSLLEGALGQDVNRISAQEALSRVWGVVNGATARVMKLVNDNLPAFVEDELQKTTDPTLEDA